MHFIQYNDILGVSAQYTHRIGFWDIICILYIPVQKELLRAGLFKIIILFRCADLIKYRFHIRLTIVYTIIFHALMEF